MTTIMASFIAIVLFGLVTMATISYGDVLGMMATPDAMQMADRLQSGAEVVAQVQNAVGSRATSLDELVDGGLTDPLVADGATFQMACADERCSPTSLCLSMDDSADARAMAEMTATKVKGVVSGVCGDPDAAIGDKVVVALDV